MSSPQREGSQLATELGELEEKFDYVFRNRDLLRRAITHKSYAHEAEEDSSYHNESMEFLGDAVLDFFVADKLYREFPQLSEGEMTKLRAAVVRRDTLARVGRSMHLGEYLYMGRGEEATGGRNKTANLAGAFEAIVAAVFLDQGSAIAE